MKNNIGFVKALLFNKLKNDYFETGGLNESKSEIKEFFSLIKESELLQQEFNAFKNLEKKFIDNDVMATRYIDETISKFKKFTKEEYLCENKKLDKYVTKGIIDTNKNNLYEAIDTLIFQTISDDIDVDKIHESFVTVLTHLTTNKVESLNETVLNDMLMKHFNMDDVISVAVKKFNVKYSHLNEDERTILNTLTFGDEEDKKSLFESLKSENLSILENAEKNGIEDKINITIQKINKMKFEKETLIENVTNLYELKSGLLS